jgi:hypothetical protein
MPKTPPVLTADLLVECVEYLAKRGARPVTSRGVKNRFDELGVEWGDPHGWPIRKAEDVEFASPRPRLVKWKMGARPIAYTLATSGIVSLPGWRKIRP